MTDKAQIKCRYMFQNKEKFDGKSYCLCHNELCEDLSFVCDGNCQIYEDFKQLTRKTQECEELKRKLSNQEQLYQNEIEIYNNSCLQLRQENDDLYLERLALNTANSGINALLEVKEQECDRYRKTLNEIEEYCKEQNLKYDTTACEILDIINKAKGEE